MTKHTFAICAYGDSPYLEACMKSLVSQSVKTNIILCTSTPSQYIEKLAAQYKIPVYVRQGESDIQDDWNFAYDKADSPLVTIAHQDDMYGKDYVKTLLKYYGKYPDMTLFTTDYVTVKERDLKGKKLVEWVKVILRLPLRNPKWNHFTWVKKAALMFGNSICCPACTYQKKILGDHLFQSEFRYTLDWDTLLSLAERKGRFICVERPLIYYRVHSGATTKKWIQNNKRSEEELAMFAKFWPKPAVQALEYFYKKAYGAYE
ncbi:MAG: glycosyltransferase family 2 protein [Lachnoclostridium edouardi]|uniref:glycosyltransferase family 2 protein n=1 Tax=Lachnoclostridium edouardi TaxID=1926283 RepID=UPI0026DAE547|nr:glycosyltransferase family 2 protein [Lachnoclostridium edouardi]MDO4277465.1 glycosyltransferase family 2 protein [Lachnoclostridium edouardi]